MSMKEMLGDECSEEFLACGNSACAGCTSELALRWALKALGPKTVVVAPASCTNVYIGLWPAASPTVPFINMAFAAGASAASGIVAGYEALGKTDITVMTWAGDGGTVDIGIQALSGAIERGTNFIYACYDNEIYANTGTQRSGSTPFAAITTTTPFGKKEMKKDIAKIIAAHDIPYVAVVNGTDPQDVFSTFKKIKEMHGPRFVHILSPCPPGWRYDASETVELGRLAISSGMWIMWEQENGIFSLKKASKRYLDKEKRTLVRDYMKKQGRFSLATDDDIEKIQEWVDKNWDFIQRRIDSGC
ncbi:MAG TPA: thiamine pyrophosphate-dependent enzyme [Candidatus Lokiarchaeia archaeon]|nr:thiamine pyrophosphate-dependent enzyme [Candidatus Lokiarchaeia archaeon]